MKIETHKKQNAVGSPSILSFYSSKAMSKKKVIVETVKLKVTMVSCYRVPIRASGITIGFEILGRSALPVKIIYTSFPAEYNSESKLYQLLTALGVINGSRKRSKSIDTNTLVGCTCYAVVKYEIVN